MAKMPQMLADMKVSHLIHHNLVSPCCLRMSDFIFDIPSFLFRRALSALISMGISLNLVFHEGSQRYEITN